MRYPLPDCLIERYRNDVMVHAMLRCGEQLGTPYQQVLEQMVVVLSKRAAKLEELLAQVRDLGPAVVIDAKGDISEALPTPGPAAQPVEDRFGSDEQFGHDPTCSG